EASGEKIGSPGHHAVGRALRCRVASASGALVEDYLAASPWRTGGIPFTCSGCEDSGARPRAPVPSSVVSLRTAVRQEPSPAIAKFGYLVRSPARSFQCAKRH